MEKKTFNFWVPRVLGISFIAFISLFAMDVFGEGKPLWEMVVGFLIHLVPSYFLTAVLLIAWKWERIGGILYILLGIFYIVTARGMQWSAYLFISGPIFVIGGLFLLRSFTRKTKHSYT